MGLSSVKNVFVMRLPYIYEVHRGMKIFKYMKNTPRDLLSKQSPVLVHTRYNKTIANFSHRNQKYTFISTTSIQELTHATV